MSLVCWRPTSSDDNDADILYLGTSVAMGTCVSILTRFLDLGLRMGSFGTIRIPVEDEDAAEWTVASCEMRTLGVGRATVGGGVSMITTGLDKAPHGEGDVVVVLYIGGGSVIERVDEGGEGSRGRGLSISGVFMFIVQFMSLLILP